MAQVILRDVCKVYPNGVKAVDSVTIDIADSEFIVLVGPSGCGKSTTLRMVAGLEEITSGTISIGGRVVNDVPPKDRDIAMVFQNYALYPYMTVYDNMAFSLKLRRRQLGLSRGDIDRKVRETAATLGISDLLGRRPKALSGGQRQRVAVGRAIVRSPRAFLFDEPLSNLDAKLRGEMRAELKKLHRRLATTTIYVTHDQEEAMTLGDRLVVMKDGVTQQVGSPLDVYTRPVNRFVAGFVGSPPMNFLSGRLRREHGDLYFEESGGRLRLSEPMVRAISGRPEGADVVLGVRPEAMSLEAAGVRAGAAGSQAMEGLRTKVSVVEPLGHHMDVFMSTSANERLVARVDGRTAVREGDELVVRVDMSQAHLFDTDDTGMNLTLNQNGATHRAS